MCLLAESTKLTIDANHSFKIKSTAVLQFASFVEVIRQGVTRLSVCVTPSQTRPVTLYGAMILELVC